MQSGCRPFQTLPNRAHTVPQGGGTTDAVVEHLDVVDDAGLGLRRVVYRSLFVSVWSRD